MELALYACNWFAIVKLVGTNAHSGSGHRSSSDITARNKVEVQDSTGHGQILLCSGPSYLHIEAQWDTPASFRINPQGLQRKAVGTSARDMATDTRARCVANRQHQQLLLHSRYVELMTKPAYSLKLQGEVAIGTDPAAHMLSYLDCPARVRADILSELPLHYPFTLSIAEVKQAVLRAYLAWRLGCSREQIALLVRKYPSVENRSLQFLRHTIELLTNHFHMPTDKILRNGFVLLAHPGNLESQLSQVRHLAGLEMRELAVLCPRLLTVPAENLIRVERLLQAHGITPAQVQRCIRIYSLSPETIEKRLKEITRVAEFEVRRECPRLLNLVYYASKARHRLELLSQLGHPASGVSINVLSMAASDFARVFYSGSDRGRPRETAEYLAHLLRKPEAEVRQRLASHPSAKRISLLNTRRVVDWLLPRGVTHEQLWYGLQVVLYDSELVASHFLRLPERDELQPYSEWRDCPELLEVLLYYIEREARFTGHTQLGLFSKVEASDSTSHEKANQAASLQNPYFHPATLPAVQKEEEQTEEDDSSSS
ncbi:mitochondrial transcription termination factor 5 isoform X2 [Dermacentor variabilis]|uniref:mitochondrial transcription termination factor 5 isoform X2 n=2 Tax=Dermacentor variabilis TaxID=34621 RepID=UPI003F5B11CB